ncbi:MAG: domain containing protein [Massilia sp.]|nr:domain containing protein [Massilia sp.]
MLAAMSNQPQPRRVTCATCLRPQPACICAWIAPLDTAVSVLILQHPLEVSSAKGSARLLHLSLPGSVLLTGEAFDPDVLSGLLHEGGRTPVLLYPSAVGYSTPPPLDPAILAAPSALRLVVLDGTWRKSRKMLHLNPQLQGLLRLALQGMPASHYRIRKAHAPDQLSTLEAAAYALMQLDGGAARCAPLIDAFDGFVAQQAARIPHLA